MTLAVLLTVKVFVLICARYMPFVAFQHIFQSGTYGFQDDFAVKSHPLRQIFHSVTFLPLLHPIP